MAAVASAQEWTEAAKLTALDGETRDWLGKSVSISGDTALLGAEGDDTERGAAYVFERVGGGWVQTAKLTALDGETRDWLGKSVSISGDTLIAGAYGDEPLGGASGSVYVFDAIPGCPGDFNSDNIVDTRDVTAFLNAWAAGDGGANFDENGTIDTRDVLAFLNAWADGC